MRLRHIRSQVNHMRRQRGSLAFLKILQAPNIPPENELSLFLARVGLHCFQPKMQRTSDHCEGLGGGKVPRSTLCLKLGVKQCYPTFLRQDFPDPLTWSHLGDSLKEKTAFGVSQSIFRIDSFCCFVRAIGRACSLCFLTPETFHF